MCVTSLLCGPRAELWPFYVFLCKRFSLSARGPHRRDVTHILSKVSCFLLKSFHFRRLQKLGFFPIQIFIFWMLCNNAPMLANAHISSLGYLWRSMSFLSGVLLSGEAAEPRERAASPAFITLRRLSSRLLKSYVVPLRSERNAAHVYTSFYQPWYKKVRYVCKMPRSFSHWSGD